MKHHLTNVFVKFVGPTPPTRIPRCGTTALLLRLAFGLAMTAVCSTAQDKTGATTNAAAFNFVDFKDITRLNLSATVHQRDGILHLTENAPSVNGLVFYREKLPLTPGFEMSFAFRISGGPGIADYSDGSGGDGFAVVIQNVGPTAVPPWTGYIPYQLPGALAVEFDTWMNGNLGDPDGNHISVQRVPQQLDAAGPFAAFEHTRSIAWGTPPVNLADGQVHTVRMVYRNGVLQVFFDQMKEPVVVADTDLAGAVDAHGMGYLGFAAGTAAAFQRHEILSWSFKTTVGNSL